MNATECPPCPKCGASRKWTYFDTGNPRLKPIRRTSGCVSDKCVAIAKDAEKREAEYEKDAKILRLQQAKENCGFKPRHMNMTFDTWDGAYPDISIENGAFLYGDNGRGKTHLLCAIGHRLVEKGFSVLFVNAVELLNEIRSSFGRESEETDAILSRYSSAQYLLLDDLGAEKGGEWVIETFYLLLNRRWESYSPTLVTSNLTPGEIAEKLGKRIASRLLGSADIREIKSATDRRKP